MNWMPRWPELGGPMLQLALVLLLAAGCGEGAVRLLRLPRVTGYSVAGLLLGVSGIGGFGAQDLAAWRIVIDLALAVLLFELGMHVDLRWLRANRMLLASSVFEAALSFVAVFAVMRLLGAVPALAAAVAAIAMVTSPAVIMRVTAELRSRGQVTDRLIVLSALNVTYAAVALNLAIGGMHSAAGHGGLAAVLHPVYLICGPLLVAFVLARAFAMFRRRLDVSDEQGAAVLFGLLLLALAVLAAARLPVVLAPLLAGVLVRNTDRRPHVWPRHFGTAGGLLVMLMFVLTGVSVMDAQWVAGGVAALALIAVRAGSKALAVAAFGPPSGLSWRQSGAVALGLMPMSGVAFVLAHDYRTLFPAHGEPLVAIVFTAVVVLELAGPVAVQVALRWAGETREAGP